MVVEIHLEIQNLAQRLQGVDKFAQLEQLALLAQLERVALLAQLERVVLLAKHLQGVVEMNSQRTGSRASSNWIVGLGR